VCLIAAATVMLSCLESQLHFSTSSTTKKTLSSVPVLRNADSGYLVKSAVVHPANLPSRAVDKNGFFKFLGLVPAQTSGLNGHSTRNAAVECDVIVIDDEDDDEPIAAYRNNCKADLFGTTRPLRGDLQINGNASSRLLQPNSRLRKLLSIDVSSNLGSRVLRNVMSTLKSDGLPLNPYTVSHSLSGSDNALDYGTFCRTPVKGINGGRLRHREFPVKYRPASADTHYHYYCLTRADRRRFCRRFDTGLSARSRRLQRKYRHCAVILRRLTEEEASDWHSSQRLRDYVTKMQEKERENAALNVTPPAADDEVICLSSDSEDDLPLSVKKQDLMFRCHQCNVKLPCGDGFQRLIREHYKTYHGIVNIDIIRVVQPNGAVAMQIIHVPPAVEEMSPVVSNGSLIDLCSAETSSTPPPQQSTSASDVCQDPSQNPINPPLPDEAQPVTWMQPSGAAEPMLAIGISGHRVPLNHMLTELSSSIRPPAMISGPVPALTLPRTVIRNSALLNGSAHCRGDAVSSPPASVPSSFDADIICLD